MQPVFAERAYGMHLCTISVDNQEPGLLTTLQHFGQRAGSATNMVAQPDVDTTLVAYQNGRVLKSPIVTVVTWLKVVPCRWKRFSILGSFNVETHPAFCITET